MLVTIDRMISKIIPLRLIGMSYSLSHIHHQNTHTLSLRRAPCRGPGRGSGGPGHCLLTAATHYTHSLTLLQHLHRTHYYPFHDNTIFEVEETRDNKTKMADDSSHDTLPFCEMQLQLKSRNRCVGLLRQGHLISLCV